MNRFLLFLPMLLIGCASTTFRDPRTGVEVAKFQGDMWDMHYKDGYREWSASRVSHSAATRAGGSVLGTGLSGATAVATAILTKGLVK